MNLQVIVSTMNQSDYTLLDKMNIQSDAVVINQCDKNEVSEFDYKGHKIKWISMTERGVGLSRNTGILHATADIILFADDDIKYCDGYVQGVLNAFEKNDDADVVCFNINLVNSTKNIGGHRNNTENKKLKVFNSMRYGACLIAARRKVLLRERIMFSLLFGGGAEFMSGEDSIFIKDCHDAGLNLYADTFCLGDVDDSGSSWYKGINDEFFVHRGMVYATAFSKTYPVIFLYYAWRNARIHKEYSIKKIYSLFIEGKKMIQKYR
jgi:glycosyltransferase involved in cell wall biosynthesis